MASRVVFVLLLLKTAAVSQARGIPQSGRIINGNVVTENDFPWHVSIKSVNANRTIQCSGSIISSEWILTAGQCVNGFESFIISLGVGSPNGLQCTVVSTNFVLHPSYKGALTNDLALIRLPTPLTFTDSVAPVKLPDKSYGSITFVGSRARVSGWNTLLSELRGIRVDYLYWVELSIITNTKCAQYLGSQITSNAICADAFREGNISDSDYGTAMVVCEDDEWMQVGVSSYVQHSTSGTMSAYMRISSYFDWIQQTIT